MGGPAQICGQAPVVWLRLLVSGSDAFIHASCKVTADFSASCDSVVGEIRARVNGQYGQWHDPHNNGTYTIDGWDGEVMQLTRVTQNKKYTDKLNYKFKPSGAGCTLYGCSESQVKSMKDFSTNYCNLRMLYCSSKDGCPTASEDLSSDETKVDPSLWATSEKSDCFR